MFHANLAQQTGGNGREGGGEGGASGSGGARDSHRDASNHNSGHRSSMAKNPHLSVSGGLPVDRGSNSNVETQSSGGGGAGSAYDDDGYSPESAAGEDEQRWEDHTGPRGANGEEGGDDFDSAHEEVNVSRGRHSREI